MVLALVLGPMLEEAFRQSLMLSGGHFSIFVSRPISVIFMSVAVLLLVIPLIKHRKTLNLPDE
jgi:putative tricarboxylic transport membrane protein